MTAAKSIAKVATVRATKDVAREQYFSLTLDRIIILLSCLNVAGACFYVVGACFYVAACVIDWFLVCLLRYWYFLFKIFHF